MPWFYKPYMNYEDISDDTVYRHSLTGPDQVLSVLKIYLCSRKIRYKSENVSKTVKQSKATLPK